MIGGVVVDTHYGERDPKYGGIPICTPSLSGPLTDGYSMDRNEVTCPDCIRELLAIDVATEDEVTEGAK